MDALREYVIPVGSLKNGQHTFQYEVDWQFFSHFVDSPVQQGRFDVEVTIDKQPDHWLVHFDIDGALDTDCDRCLAPISLPVQGGYDLIVKYSESGESDDADLVYVSPDVYQWKIAQLIYEFILLSIPVKHIYACEDENPRPCDDQALTKLQREESQASTTSLGDALKRIELNK